MRPDTGRGPVRPDEAPQNSQTTGPMTSDPITNEGTAPGRHRQMAAERRGAAAARMVPLDRTGRPDPEDPRPSRYDAPEEVTTAAVSDWADSVQHLAGLGYDVRELVPEQVRQAWPRHARAVREMRAGRRELAHAGEVVS